MKSPQKSPVWNNNIKLALMLLYKLNGDAVDQTYIQALVSLSSQVLLEDMSLLQGSVFTLN